MTFRRSPLALAVLGLLAYEPLHPYGIQQLLRHWGKGEVVNVGQRATLYKIIGRLRNEGLIAVHGTARDQQYPERTVYALTDAGRAASVEWLHDMLATPRREYPEFPAALAFLPLIDPAETLALLRKRRELVTKELAHFEAQIAETADLPRVPSLEIEYLHAVTTAELRWTDALIHDLSAGHVTWSGLSAARATQEGAPLGSYERSGAPS
jgi:DNA-binding PadR family transcriptional regulator